MTPVIRPRYTARMAAAEELLRTTPIFSRLSPDDRRKIAEVATVRRFERGDLIFEQESPSDALYAIASGRVKIFKMMPNGKDVILEVFGPGDPLGAVATYVGRPFPASAVGARRHDLRGHPAGGFLPTARTAPVARPRTAPRFHDSASSSSPTGWPR